jgi:glc operon protein GlcG
MNWEEFMRNLYSIISAICFLLLICTQAQAQQPPAPPLPPPFSYGAPITLEQAKKVAAAAEEAAKKRHMIVVIAIVEPTGDLVYFQKMDGAQYASIKVAQAKARSAAIYGRATKIFRSRIANGDLSPMALAGAVASDGGIPIVVNGKTIGAIGSSGGADEDISQAGADALK